MTRAAARAAKAAGEGGGEGGGGVGGGGEGGVGGGGESGGGEGVGGEGGREGDDAQGDEPGIEPGPRHSKRCGGWGATPRLSRVAGSRGRHEGRTRRCPGPSRASAARQLHCRR